MLQKHGAIPVVLDGNLRKEQPAPSGHADQQAVPADLDLIRLDRFRRRKNTKLDFQITRLFYRHWMESRVLESRRAGCVGDSLIYGRNRQNVPDASAQLAAQMERREDASRIGKMAGRRIHRNPPRLERCQY